MGKLTNLIVERSLSVADGHVKMFNKIDYIMFPASSMGDFLQKIGEDFGDKYQFELGYYAGNDGANEMMNKLGLISKTVPMNLKVILKMFETLGFGEMDFKIFNAHKGKLLLHLTKHPVIEYAKKKFKKKSHICPHYQGIYSIHADKELKVKNCNFVETQCICKGAKFCEWSTNVLDEKEDKLKLSDKKRLDSIKKK